MWAKPIILRTALSRPFGYPWTSVWETNHSLHKFLWKLRSARFWCYSNTVRVRIVAQCHHICQRWSLTQCLISTGPRDASRSQRALTAGEWWCSRAAESQFHSCQSNTRRLRGEEATLRKPPLTPPFISPLTNRSHPPGPPACPCQPARSGGARLHHELRSVGGDREQQSHAHTGERGQLGEDAQRGERGESSSVSVIPPVWM